MNTTVLTSLVDERQNRQRDRIRTQLRIKAVEAGRDTMDDEGLMFLRELYQRQDDAEADAETAIKDYLRRNRNPLVDEMVQVKGIGLILAAKIVHSIDFGKCPTVAALWRYAGYGLVPSGYHFSCGHTAPEFIVGQRGEISCPQCQMHVHITQTNHAAERPKRGEKLHYNKNLKTALRLTAESFVKSRAPYRKIYDAERARLDTEPRYADWTDLHRHNAALRKMVKIFLEHLWRRGRTLAGLPTPGLYILDQGEHQTYISAKQFGWPEE